MSAIFIKMESCLRDHDLALPIPVELFTNTVIFKQRMLLNKYWWNISYKKHLEAYEGVLFTLPSDEETFAYINKNFYDHPTYSFVIVTEYCGTEENAKMDASFNGRYRTLFLNTKMQLSIEGEYVTPKNAMEEQKEMCMYSHWYVDIAICCATIKTARKMMLNKMTQLACINQKVLFAQLTSWLSKVWTVEFLLNRYAYTGHAMRYATYELLCNWRVGGRSKKNMEKVVPSLHGLKVIHDKMLKTL